MFDHGIKKKPQHMLIKTSMEFSISHAENLSECVEKLSIHSGRFSTTTIHGSPIHGSPIHGPPIIHSFIDTFIFFHFISFHFISFHSCHSFIPFHSSFIHHIIKMIHVFGDTECLYLTASPPRNRCIWYHFMTFHFISFIHSFIIYSLIHSFIHSFIHSKNSVDHTVLKILAKSYMNSYWFLKLIKSIHRVWNHTITTTDPL